VAEIVIMGGGDVIGKALEQAPRMRLHLADRAPER
jgi:hypothetical protein